MPQKLLVSISDLHERLGVLESQGHGDARLELKVMAPAMPKKLIRSVSATLELLEQLELQGYGATLLELGPITASAGTVLLNPETEIRQLAEDAWRDKPYVQKTRSPLQSSLGHKVKAWLRLARRRSQQERVSG
jgi:hypothetical protein